MIVPFVPRRSALSALTSLRFVAALGVVLYHLEGLKLSPKVGWLYTEYLSDGSCWVGFFFLLSGFVLAYSYADRFRSLRPRDLWDYAAARFARIYPLHLIALGLVLVPFFRFNAWPEPAAATRVLAEHATLTQAWDKNLVGAVLTHNSVAWSLSVEVFFYATLPLLLFALTRLPVRHPAVWPAAAAVVWVWQMVWQYKVMISGHPNGMYFRVVYPPARLGEFVVGVLLGLGFVRSGGATAGGPTWRGTVAEVLAVAALAVQHAFAHGGYLLPGWQNVGYYTPAFALIVVTFARQAGYLSHAAARPGLVFLGEASYALYVFHYLVLAVVIHRVPHLGGAHPEFAAVLVVAASVGVSVLAHLSLELPLRTACLYVLRGRWRRPKSDGVVPFVRSAAKAA